MLELVLIGLISFVVVGLNVEATLAIARDAFSEPRQKVLQLALVWQLPLLGAIVTLAIHRPIEEPSRRYREPPDAGDDHALSGRSHKNLYEAIDGD
jgi:hypothetical protein